MGVLARSVLATRFCKGGALQPFKAFATAEISRFLAREKRARRATEGACAIKLRDLWEAAPRQVGKRA